MTIDARWMKRQEQLIAEGMRPAQARKKMLREKAKAERNPPITAEEMHDAVKQVQDFTRKLNEGK